MRGPRRSSRRKLEAGVVVNKEADKYASAHDLRRAFGTRWAPKVKPATLQLLMRHASIETTLRCYVAQDADDVADELWASHWADAKAVSDSGNTPGNTDQKGASTKGSKNRRNSKS